jgi:hypothetical protein
MTIEDRSERILKRYNELKEKRIQLETKRDMLLNEMKEKYGVSSVEELRAKADEYTKDIGKYEKKLMPILEELEEGLGL